METNAARCSRLSCLRPLFPSFTTLFILPKTQIVGKVSKRSQIHAGSGEKSSLPPLRVSPRSFPSSVRMLDCQNPQNRILLDPPPPSFTPFTTPQEKGGGQQAEISLILRVLHFHAPASRFWACVMFFELNPPFQFPPPQKNFLLYTVTKQLLRAAIFENEKCAMFAGERKWELLIVWCLWTL